MWLFILHKVEYEVKDKAKREVITWNIGKKEISIENIRTLLSVHLFCDKCYSAFWSFSFQLKLLTMKH